MLPESERDLLIQLDAKLDGLLTQFAAHVAHEDGERAKMDGRVTRLEEWKWRWAGAVGILVIVLTFIGNLAARAFVP